MAGSEDHTIKAQRLNSKTDDEIYEFKGHHGPIFHIDLNDKNQMVSSSGDGMIYVWNLDTREIIKKFDGFEKFEKFTNSKSYCTPALEKTGRYLAFPKDSHINVVETTNWEIKFKLENKNIQNKYTVCSFSHCGNFLAAGSTQGEMSIWSLTDNSAIKGEIFGEDIHPITSIEWNPKELNEVAFCDSDGQLSTIRIKSGKIADDDEPMMTENIDEDIRDPNDIYDAIDFRDDDEEDNENCIALEKLKNETMKKSPDSDTDEDDDVKTVKSNPLSVAGRYCEKSLNLFKSKY